MPEATPHTAEASQSESGRPIALVLETSQDNPNALERNIPVFICRGAKFGTLEKLWPKAKKWAEASFGTPLHHLPEGERT